MLHKIKHRLVSLKLEHGLLAVLGALPLIFIPSNMQLSETMRWAVLLSVAATMLLSPPLRSGLVKGFQSLGRVSQLATLTLIGAMLLSTFVSSQTWPVRLVGWSNEYMGLLSWLSFIVIAVALGAHLKSFVRSGLFLVICGLVTTGSLLVDIPFITHGFRPPGLLFQETATGVYAALSVVVSLWHIMQATRHQILASTVMTTSILALLLCQSRAAQFAAVFVCGIYATHSILKKQRVGVVAVIALVVLIVAPLIGGAYFNRMRGEQVQAGIDYRWDIYQTSAAEIVKRNPVTGLGPSGIPESINSKSQAPQGIVETLNEGYVFLSAHDLFLDIALCFGLVGALAFLLLVLRATLTLLVSKMTPELLLLGGLFFVLLINALLNVPSVELTALLFLVTGALLPRSSSGKL